MAYSYDDRDREFRQSPPPRPPRKEDNDLGSWILIIFLFIVAWPAVRPLRPERSALPN